MSHTPGPWKLVPAKNPSYNLVCAERWHKLARVVVRMMGHGSDSEEGVANARLIAAAPELLEAAEKALQYMRLHKYADQAWADDLASAIAKAKGTA